MSRIKMASANFNADEATNNELAIDNGFENLSVVQRLGQYVGLKA